MVTKKGRFAPALPLRHVGDIVIWEGNYRSDILNFGIGKKNLISFFTERISLSVPEE